MIGLREGHRLVDAHLPRLGGEWTRISELFGGTTLFYLWASWQKHREGLKILEEFYRSRRESFGVVGIAYDVQSVSYVSRWVKKYGVTFPMLLDNACHLTRLWGVKKLPILLVVDEEGFIERIEREPTSAILDWAAAARDVSAKRTRVFEPPKLFEADPKIEAMLQEVTNLLGRSRKDDALKALKAASRAMPDNEIISAQLDVIEHPEKYF